MFQSDQRVEGCSVVDSEIHTPERALATHLTGSSYIHFVSQNVAIFTMKHMACPLINTLQMRLRHNIPLQAATEAD